MVCARCHVRGLQQLSHRGGHMNLAILILVFVLVGIIVVGIRSQLNSVTSSQLLPHYYLLITWRPPLRTLTSGFQFLVSNIPLIGPFLPPPLSHILTVAGIYKFWLAAWLAVSFRQGCSPGSGFAYECKYSA